MEQLKLDILRDLLVQKFWKEGPLLLVVKSRYLYLSDAGKMLREEPLREIDSVCNEALDRLDGIVARTNCFVTSLFDFTLPPELQAKVFNGLNTELQGSSKIYAMVLETYKGTLDGLPAVLEIASGLGCLSVVSLLKDLQCFRESP